MRNAQCLNAKNHPPVAGFLAIGNLRLIVGDGGTGIGWIPYCTVPTGNTSNSCFNRSFLRKAWSAEPLGGKLWLKLWWQVRFRFCLGVDRGNVSGETNYQTHLGLHHKKKYPPWPTSSWSLLEKDFCVATGVSHCHPLDRFLSSLVGVSMLDCSSTKPNLCVKTLWSSIIIIIILTTLVSRKNEWSHSSHQGWSLDLSRSPHHSSPRSLARSFAPPRSFLRHYCAETAPARKMARQCSTTICEPKNYVDQWNQNCKKCYLGQYEVNPKILCMCIYIHRHIISYNHGFSNRKGDVTIPESLLFSDRWQGSSWICTHRLRCPVICQSWYGYRWSEAIKPH